MRSRPLVVIGYSDKDGEWKDRLVSHLQVHAQQGLFDLWDESLVLPGAEPLADVRKSIDVASVVILLITADFLGSDHIQDEFVSRALRRRSRDGLHVVPVLLKPCDWVTFSWLCGVSRIPRDGGFVADRASAVDAEFAAVAAEVRRVLNPGSISPGRKSVVPKGVADSAADSDSLRRLHEVQLAEIRARLVFRCVVAVVVGGVCVAIVGPLAILIAVGLVGTSVLEFIRMIRPDASLPAPPHGAARSPVSSSLLVSRLGGLVAAIASVSAVFVVAFGVVDGLPSHVSRFMRGEYIAADVPVSPLRSRVDDTAELASISSPAQGALTQQDAPDTPAGVYEHGSTGARAPGRTLRAPDSSAQDSVGSNVHELTRVRPVEVAPETGGGIVRVEREVLGASRLSEYNLSDLEIRAESMSIRAALLRAARCDIGERGRVLMRVDVASGKIGLVQVEDSNGVGAAAVRCVTDVFQGVALPFARGRASYWVRVSAENQTHVSH
ncbi:toll/interleukin-1 receptor domain-containing protein [Sorangium sp. So ce131]|uniref:toll/interleukin-1 receptor domain-containing protein n=1 Tax=Sorangium sp. So ce131 TaxID=3133282 RepID=UPI003F6109D1